MKTINHQFIQNNLTRQFVEQTMNTLIYYDDTILSDKRYWLYYYVKTDYDMILNSLYNYNLESDFMGFPNQQKVIRHQIEAFLDLYNLCHDQSYELVLMKNNHENVDLGKYEKFLGKGFFYNNKQKLSIAIMNHFQYDEYLQPFIEKSNQYVHPNIYIPPMNEYEKIRLIRDLINASIFLMAEAYQLMIASFAPKGVQPHLNCQNCSMFNGNCGLCFKNLVSNDRDYVYGADDLIMVVDSKNFNQVYSGDLLY